MRRQHRLVLFWLVAIVVATSCSGSEAPSNADALVSIGAGLQGPSGLTATVYATGLPHASAFAFDTQGRLWVSTAAFADDGTDFVAMVPHSGSAPVTVLTNAHTPLGLLWLDDVLYVASHSGVEAYAGFDGSAFAAHHTVVSLPTDVGEVNGLARAPDGRLLLGVSAPCDHCSPTNADSGAILSFRPDGSGLSVYASGIRAPIALVFHPDGADLFVTMNLRDDLGDKTPGDWLAVVAEGQKWGSPDCWGQGGTACAGVPDPVAELDPHAALSGVAIVSGQLGATLTDTAIVAEWGEVKAVKLTKDATGYHGTVSTFLTGMKNPMPVALSTHGVLVADWTTGTVFEITSGGA
jgi:glucose/arabinose dehydrogenase